MRRKRLVGWVKDNEFLSRSESERNRYEPEMFGWTPVYAREAPQRSKPKTLKPWPGFNGVH